MFLILQARRRKKLVIYLPLYLGLNINGVTSSVKVHDIHLKQLTDKRQLRQEKQLLLSHRQEKVTKITLRL